MVDPFALARTSCRDRFTIWSQYQNERYRNEGTRIDFTLCDKELWEQHGRVGGPLDGYVPPSSSLIRCRRECCCWCWFVGTGRVYCLVQRSSQLQRIPAGPVWRGHAKERRGISGAPPRTLERRLRPPRGQGNLHTGIIYTPVLGPCGRLPALDDSIKAGMSLPLALKEDKETRAATAQGAKTMLFSVPPLPSPPAQEPGRVCKTTLLRHHHRHLLLLLH